MAHKLLSEVLTAGKVDTSLFFRSYVRYSERPKTDRIAWTLYEEELQKLSDRFGQPTSITYSVQPTGNKSEDGLALINGAGIEAKFLSTRTKATLTVYRKGTTTVCYKTNFSASK